jgi:uncharacterized protein (DUF305 family)
MKRILLASVASVFVIGSALAQQATPMPGMDMKGMDMKMMMPSPNDPPSTKGYKSAMMKMMEAMPKFTGDADIDFMKQMQPPNWTSSWAFGLKRDSIAADRSLLVMS